MAAMTDPAPDIDDRHPADVVTAMVDYVLDPAETWPRWDLQPIEVPVEGEPPRVYTPHKAVRRVADHLLDHLAEIEARLAGRPTEPDRWHGSSVTTASDLAQFTHDDLDEAKSRLRRLALIRKGLGGLGLLYGSHGEHPVADVAVEKAPARRASGAVLNGRPVREL